MKKVFGWIFVGVISFFPLLLKAQMALGEWMTHMAYYDSSMNVYWQDKVYAVSKGSLFSYNISDEDILTYDLVNSLSDVSIQQIALCPSSNSLLLVYETGNIDLMNSSEEVYNITDFKNSSFPDKTINEIYIEGKKAYLSTNFGIIVLDVDKREIAVTYVLNRKINSCVIFENAIWTATDEGLYRGELNENLLNINNWKLLTQSVYNSLLVWNGKIYASSSDALGVLDLKDGSFSKVLNGVYTHFNVFNDELFVGNGEGKIQIIEKNHAIKEIAVPDKLLSLSYGKDIYWVSTDGQGLAGYKLDEQSFEQVVAPLVLNAPKYNYFYQSLIHKDKFYSCGGGIFLDRYYRPGTVQVLDSDGFWKIYQDEGITAQTGKRVYQDITSIAVDPDDDTHLFAASAGEGLYEFKDGKFVSLFTPENSGVSSDYRYKNIIRVNGLQYDRYKNLWMLCAGADNVISVYTAEKKWISLYYDDISRVETFRGTFFDSRGWMWCLTPNYTKTGIFVLNHKGTIEDVSDDQSIFIDEIVNQDGTSIAGEIMCAVEDKDGSIWIGTTQGPFVLTNPDKVFDGNTSFTQIKVPRNDGTNYADYLLDGVLISAIAIDGANRKWIGTESNGIYLLSDDGLEEIHHFTTTNSPLLSDGIESIAIDDKKGLVYIGTSKGLNVYQSDATQAENSFSESKVRAYPNPVKPDYEGYVMIKGLMQDSNVKITDSYGSLIHEGVSVGGSFSWNGRNAKGERVASGIYHVMAVDSEGNDGIVTKIVVIK